MAWIGEGLGLSHNEMARTGTGVAEGKRLARMTDPGSSRVFRMSSNGKGVKRHLSDWLSVPDEHGVLPLSLSRVRKGYDCLRRLGETEKSRSCNPSG